MKNKQNIPQTAPQISKLEKSAREKDSKKANEQSRKYGEEHKRARAKHESEEEE